MQIIRKSFYLTKNVEHKGQVFPLASFFSPRILPPFDAAVCLDWIAI